MDGRAARRARRRARIEAAAFGTLLGAGLWLLLALAGL